MQNLNRNTVKTKNLPRNKTQMQQGYLDTRTDLQKGMGSCQTKKKDRQTQRITDRDRM